MWGLGLFPNLDSVHNRAIRTYLGVHKYTPLLALKGEMALPPPSIRRKTEMMRLWNRLNKLPENRLPKQVFNIEFKKQRSWCKNIKSIFEQSNMLEDFNSKNSVDLFNFNQTQLLIFKDNYTESLPKQDKLRNYAMYKFSFDTEPYVQKYMSRNKRSLFAQIRTGVLPLRVETGRFRGLPLQERTCEYCLDGSVEDEHHFLFSCNKWDSIRHPFLDKCTEVCPDFGDLDEVEQFRFVMNDEHIQLHTAEYVCTAFHMRKNLF